MSSPTARARALFADAPDTAVRAGFCRCDASEPQPLVEGKCEGCWEKTFAPELCSACGEHLPPVGERECDECIAAEFEPEMVERRDAAIAAQEAEFAAPRVGRRVAALSGFFSSRVSA